MRRTQWMVALGALLVALATGCAKVQKGTSFNGQGLTADASTPVAHVYATIDGVYLLGVVPLIAGDPDTGGVAFFSDTVTVGEAAGLVTRESNSLKATRTVDLQSSTTGLWLVPTLVLWYRSVEASGNAVKP